MTGTLHALHAVDLQLGTCIKIKFLAAFAVGFGFAQPTEDSRAERSLGLH